MRPLLTTRLLVTLGITCLVASALISFLQVQQAGRELEHYRQLSATQERQITTLWQDVAHIDSRADMALWFASQQPENADMVAYFVARFSDAKKDGLWTVDNVMVLAASERQARLDAINRLYEEKLNAEEAMMHATHRQQQYGALALVLQLAGLVMIILRRDVPNI